MSVPTSLLRIRYHTPKLHIIHRTAFPAKCVRCLAIVHHSYREISHEFWFNASGFPRRPLGTAPDPKKPAAERLVKLGNTIRILQARLPTLLQSPLPSEILSPHISLHLFPSTHPHLPVVTGRVGYVAALWTSPLAWGRVPIVGNVKLEILSERMVKNNMNANNSPEQLVVRWRTCGKTKGKGTGPYYKGIGVNEQVDKITEFLGGGAGEDDTKEFTGLFIFEFDEEARIVSHTIEHMQSGGNWDKGVGARVVGLTDWLLGGLKGASDEGTGQPCPAFWSKQRRQGCLCKV